MINKFNFCFLAVSVFFITINVQADTYPSITNENDQEMQSISESKLPKKLPTQPLRDISKKQSFLKKNIQKNPKNNFTPPQFDEVPVEQVNSLSERLQLVHDILILYGMAYDYKTLTLKELKSIKNKLDQHSTSADEAKNELQI